jgi:putative membrane protein
MARKLIRSISINALSLALLGWLYTGLVVSFNITDFLLSVLILTVVFKIAKPLFDLILLPLNLLSLGLFKWVKIAICYFIAVYFSPGMSITNFTFAGFNEYGLNIPSFTTSKLVSLLIGSFLLQYLRKFIPQLFKTR